MCVFCEIISNNSLAFLVDETKDTLTFLDKRPLFHGHCLLVPKLHYTTLDELPDNLVGPLFKRARLLSAAVKSATGAQGTFVAMNNTVSQSVPHLHIHIVPRTRGDGLKGFFWPRRPYRNNEQMVEISETIRRQIRQIENQG